jgi:hypothetical protein
VQLTAAVRRGGPLLQGGEESRSPEATPWP